MKSKALFEQCDLHIHTHLSPCARSEMRLRPILDACERRGIRYLGITDHISAASNAWILTETRKELTELRAPVQVWLGCEADILAVGEHTITAEVRSSVDYVMAAANHFHLPSVAHPLGESLEAVGRHILEMFRYACTLEFVDVMAHPMLVFAGTFDPTCVELLSDRDLEQAIEPAVQNKIAMEISPRMLTRDQMYFRMRFYSLCKKAGLKFSIGSDAHSLGSVGRTETLVTVIGELGITDGDIWLPDGGRTS